MVKGLLVALSVVEAQENKLIQSRNYYSESEFTHAVLAVQSIKIDVEKKIVQAKKERN
mgnify:CR=1 FL=1